MDLSKKKYVFSKTKFFQDMQRFPIPDDWANKYDKTPIVQIRRVIETTGKKSWVGILKGTNYWVYPEWCEAL